MKFKGLFMGACLVLALTCSTVLAKSTNSATCNLVYFFNAWAPATAPGAPNGVIYGLLVNLSKQTDTLLDASTDAAQAVELHTSSMDANGVMQMTPVQGGVAVAANGYAELESGGLHMMLVNLTQPLQAGSSIELTLHFANAGNVQISVPVQAVNADGTTAATEASGMGMVMSDMNMAAATPEASTPAVDWGAPCKTVHVVGPWARASIPGAPNTVAYGLLLNLTDSPDTLVSASTDAAQAAELHDTMAGANGTMSMTPLQNGIVVPPNSAVLLKPGGMHIMLVGLKQAIQVGSTVNLTFTFAHSSSTLAALPVTAISSDMAGM